MNELAGQQPDVSKPSLSCFLLFFFSSSFFLSAGKPLNTTHRYTEVFYTEPEIEFVLVFFLLNRKGGVGLRCWRNGELCSRAGWLHTELMSAAQVRLFTTRVVRAPLFRDGALPF